MSNLNLGNVSFPGLKSRVKHGSGLKLAYATVAAHVPQDGSTDEYFVITHHGNVIAEIAENWVYVTNAGYSSSTTRSRISAILRGNNVPLYVAQRNHKQCLFQMIPVLVDGIGEHVLVTDEFQSVTWDHLDGAIRN